MPSYQYYNVYENVKVRLTPQSFLSDQWMHHAVVCVLHTEQPAQKSDSHDASSFSAD